MSSSEYVCRLWMSNNSVAGPVCGGMVDEDTLRRIASGQHEAEDRAGLDPGAERLRAAHVGRLVCSGGGGGGGLRGDGRRRCACASAASTSEQIITNTAALRMIEV